jgi:hypothetical protein
MHRFAASIHAPPAGGAAEGACAALRGVRLRTLRIDPGGLGRFAASFEEVAARFERLPRMFCEPDGAFVWTGEENGRAWQIDGLLVDRAGRVDWVDAQGACPALQLDWLLAALGWPGQAVLFQLRHEALFLDEAEFRRYAQAPAD